MSKGAPSVAGYSYTSCVPECLRRSNAREDCEEYRRPQPARHRPRAAAGTASLPGACHAALTHLRTWRLSRRTEGKRLRIL